MNNETILINDDNKNNLIRICGICRTTLNPKNTGPLEWLQPDCNECTIKDK